MAEEKQKNKIIIDAENATLGRLASYAAKQALLGKEIIIINCEKAIITGRKKNIKEKYRVKRARGSDIQKGPNFPSKADMIIKRTIRGMLPYKKERGKIALKKIKCYIGEKFEKEKRIKAGREKMGNYIKLNEISREISI